VIQQQLSTLTGFTEEMKKQGRSAGSLVVEATLRLPERDVANALGLSAGAEVWRIARIRLADGEPVAMETTEVTAALTPGLLERANFACNSLYSTLRKHYGIRPATAEQTLVATVADSSVAVPLNINVGAPVLGLTRLTRDSDGRAFEYVRSIYRGDAFVMKAFLNVGEP
jgi:GntR family transcriptional regulator